tara:strand:- start:42682 stop:42963 length:282 start_codon:yes stop_codon:yes gene_type:complete
MSDAMSEMYKSMRQDDRNEKRWQEKRKLDPELTEEYDKFSDKLGEMMEKHRFKLSILNKKIQKKQEKLKTLRYKIENNSIEKIRSKTIDKIII